MKNARKISIAMTAFLLTISMLTACGDVSADSNSTAKADSSAENSVTDNDSSSSQVVMNGTITEITGQTLMVAPEENSDELRSADLFSVGLDGFSTVEPAVGDKVAITYSGEILEIYPALLDGITNIEIFPQAEDTNCSSRFVLEGTITEISGQTILVTPVEHSDELRSSDLFSISLNGFSTVEPAVGDKISITYNGQILESDPAQLSEIYDIQIKSSDG